MLKFTLALAIFLTLAFSSFADVKKNCKTKKTEIQECTENPLELALVLDASSSINETDFGKAKKFLQDFVSQYTIGPENVRVSAITFGEGVYPEDSFELNTYSSLDEIVEALEELKYRGAPYTGTADGINYMQFVLLSPSVVRTGVDKVCIVITDGNSQRWMDTEAAAAEANKTSIAMFAVGVGNSVNNEELMRIAAGAEDRVTKVDNFEALQTIKLQLLEETCENKIDTGNGEEEEECEAELSPELVECTENPLELALVVDASSSIHPDDFERAKSFLQDFVSQYSISADKVRVSIITFGDGVYPEDGFNLDTYSTKEEVVQALGDIDYRGAEYTATSDGINYMRNNQLSDLQVRQGVEKVCIVLTDGNSQRPMDTKDAGLEAHKSNITMFAVGVGNGVNFQELKNIAAGDEGRVTKVENFGELKAFDEKLLKETCTKKLPVANEPCTDKMPTDVNFVFSPASLGREDTTWVTSFITNTVGRRGFIHGFRYGVISGSCPDDEGFSLDTYDNEDDIKERLQEYDSLRLPYLVEKLVVDGYSEKFGARDHAKKVAVIFAHGDEKSTPALLELAVNGLNLQDVQVFVVDPSGSGIEVRGAEAIEGTSPLEVSEKFISQMCAV